MAVICCYFPSKSCLQKCDFSEYLSSKLLTSVWSHGYFQKPTLLQAKFLWFWHIFTWFLLLLLVSWCSNVAFWFPLAYSARCDVLTSHSFQMNFQILENLFIPQLWSGAGARLLAQAVSIFLVALWYDFERLDTQHDLIRSCLHMPDLPSAVFESTNLGPVSY